MYLFSQNKLQFEDSVKSAAAAAAAAAAKPLQSCLTLCDPIDGSPPGSPIPGILQARTLEWVAIAFSNAWKWKVKVKSLSRARLLATPWTVAHQAPPSMGLSRQDYWSGVPLLSLVLSLICFNYSAVRFLGAHHSWEENNFRTVWEYQLVRSCAHRTMAPSTFYRREASGHLTVMVSNMITDWEEKIFCR